ncbi:MAG: Gfo/Idh/MocA family oxidoreductase [Thermoguttaceae bacterium]|jgi:predicted dehydrogenase|nr:Gfo/Idh/MocA family oxidoreductase [Thermoguttaceae bacterium]
MSEAKRTRREFLKATSAGAAGLAMVGGLNLAKSVHAAGSDRIKIALVGCGGRGTGAAANCLNVQHVLKQQIQLVAVADAFENRAKGALGQLKNQFPEQVDVPADRVFVGLDAYQKAIDCGIDLVVMAAPPGFRPSHYAYAIEKGKHVFMEKPCCTDAPGYRTLVAANKMADQKGLKVGVGLQRHHQAGYIRGVQEIHDGKLGDVMFLRVYWNGGAIWIRGREPGMTEMQYQVHNWYHFCWLSGDNITEQHVHNIDIANWVMCKDGDWQKAHPVEANGMGGCQVRNNRGIGQIFDHHYVEFTYADGTKCFSQCRQQPNTWSSVSEFVHGTKGNRGVEVRGGPKLESNNPYDQEHIDLIKAIRDGKPFNEGWFGAVSSMTATLGRMATYSGQVVKWDEAVEKGPNEFPERLAWDANPRAMPDAQGNYPMPVPGVYKPY